MIHKIDLFVSFLCMILLSSCSLSNHGGGGASVEWHISANGIDSLKLNGHQFINGGYYIIGSCTGADDNNNVQSRDAVNNILNAPGNCKGSPFLISFSQKSKNILHSVVTVGPMAVDYASLSVPLDMIKGTVTQFQFADTGYWQGGCGISTYINSDKGVYSGIPTPCPLTVPGAVLYVGLAEQRKPSTWAQASGSSGHVRRSLTSPKDVENVVLINHPSTNNIEASFGFVHKGQTVSLEEDISIY